MCRSPWLQSGAPGGRRHFGVIRHAERGDGPFATVGGQRWTQTEDFARWPLDPPLSDEGHRAANLLADQVLDFYNESGSKVDVVVTSPYLRCTQTAAAICDKLGPRTKLLVDNSLGEIYGPSVMGPSEPARAARMFEETPSSPLGQRLARCRVVGSRPSWPESPSSARRRFAGRFLWYLRWSCKAQRNFLLVTHADSVGAALKVVPSHAGQALESIDFGGMFLASLTSRAFHFTLHQEQSPEDSWLEEPSSTKRRLSESLAQASPAWRVRTDGLRLRCSGKRRSAALAQRLGVLAPDCTPARELLEMLGGRSGDLFACPQKTSSSEAEARMQEAAQPEPGVQVIGSSDPMPAAAVGVVWEAGSAVSGCGQAKSPVLSNIGCSHLLQRRRGSKPKPDEVP